MVYLVRHGQSLVNLPSESTGLFTTSGKSLGSPLTSLGKQQAQRLALAISNKTNPGTEIVILHSTARRAQQTASILFNTLSRLFTCTLGKNPYDGLCEQGQGSWEGKEKCDLYEREVSVWRGLSAQAKMQTPKVKGGESHQEVIERAVPDIEAIAKEHRGKLILVVSHHVAMHALAIHWNRPDLSTEPSSNLPELTIGNCDVLAVAVSDSDQKRTRVTMHIGAHLKV
jgi:broad specificity phosphatase PhoE